MRASALYCMLLGCVILVGCSDEVYQTSSKDVALLKRLVPNLDELAIESCDFNFVRTSKRSMVPSPSDTRWELVGHATIAPDSEGRLDQLTWEALEAASIPGKLDAVLPRNGSWLLGRNLMKANEDDRRLPNGMVVRSEAGGKVIYFLVTDSEHSIE